ncbi:tRNA uridine-5-carboxymethylaminomethyl(34) synthesis GTPase MnmE [Altererythrobacter sp. FM1]|uniref:tRNA uridine-5-carboxymethylaminomethyl(34) synthesis GTPase MnmE n=1 Tax=Tsuneonella flava TaxID=2055955 RepID=UPI000C7FDA02|nr:tRNA uridine-5-carboxymethylaminomethyl(34) synthesis GTPase MnmE [Tsuneonella flava]ROT96810.1 tRNA uridine-5-carboxymethylaminomethyl(34) synthesis GTPase MnmE [Altererythrobacter sp. FM1]
MTDTIFALSSGAPPAAIAVVRISGPRAREALAELSGKVPEPRRAVAARLYNSAGDLLDRALVLWLPGPGTATGEDTVELHLHGGRAVVSVVEAALDSAGLRRAQPGEFTRRAFANGRIDLAEAEGLADLLEAETELQRRAAMALASGALSRTVDDWRERVLGLSALVEAVLDFGDEDDVSGLPGNFGSRVDTLAGDIADWLARPRSEPLKAGFRVVLAGPPNAGKSSLFNVLLENEAAIVSPIAGTTRDIIERSVAIDGVPFTFVDTAGLHDGSDDAIEREGIGRAQAAMGNADLVLWLGPEGQGPDDAWEIESKADAGHATKASPRLRVSASDGFGIGELKRQLIEHARTCLPKPGEGALNARQHGILQDAYEALRGIDVQRDALIVAEQLRSVRVAFDRLTGRATTEDMLDALFGRFCIGK